ncbi:M15 family metallopeptidase [Leptospira meyeri]|uniref:M15 family metallopeptidase n=1 Tax=Leptospira meyeri TaxID=29508 RepID=UPI000C2A1122|nr:M15 family metallopeptidase [Leptospira meyeri]PKA26016.1 D-alanyl-D-alanine dipeptidase [Leptospira sp. mixed culture ATI2-C-A1]TGM19842.1 D-alanyl-D-alanine dipeptidase [Leptospira meyeri]
MKLIILAFCLGFPFLSLVSQSRENKLNVLDRKAYELSIQKTPNKELLNLEKTIPGILLDIKYATSNNFTKQTIYKEAKAFARKPVAEALGEAQTEFLKLGYSIKIFDAYRPYAATVKFFEIIGDTRYVASPKTGSRHNKGCAIDLTLVDIKTKKEIPMPTEYDSFRKEAWAEAPVSDPEILKNRTVLINTLGKYGFRVNKTEWWHYDFLECAGFEVLDIPFEELESVVISPR